MDYLCYQNWVASELQPPWIVNSEELLKSMVASPQVGHASRRMSIVRLLRFFTFIMNQLQKQTIFPIESEEMTQTQKHSTKFLLEGKEKRIRTSLKWFRYSEIFLSTPGISSEQRWCREILPSASYF